MSSFDKLNINLFDTDTDTWNNPGWNSAVGNQATWSDASWNNSAWNNSDAKNPVGNSPAGNNSTSDAQKWSPLSILEAYCEINEIEHFDRIYAICEKIHQHPSKPIHTFSRYGYLFRAFADFIKQKISLEAFMTLWDITSEQALTRDTVIHEAFGYLSMSLQDDPEYISDSIILIDSVANLSWTEQERDDIIKKIDRLGGEVVMI